MKKFYLFIFPLLFIAFSFVSCSDDDNDDDVKEDTSYKVRYEASCDNPNLLLRILYNTKNTTAQDVQNAVKEVYVKSPFLVELEMKKGEYCYISAQAQLDEESQTIPEDITYKCAIYIDNVLKKETSNKTAAIADYHLGMEK